MTDQSRRRFLASVVGVSTLTSLSGCNDAESSVETTTSDRTTTTTLVSPGTPGPTTSTVTTEQTSQASATPTATKTATTTATATPKPTQRPLRQRAKNFVWRLADGEYAGAREFMGGSLKSTVTRENLTRIWLGLTAQHGEFEGIVGTGRAGSLVTLRVSCVEADQTIRFRFDTDTGDLIGLRFPAEYSPPEYADEAVFEERVVTVDADGCSLPATLSVPSEVDAPPGVVLVHGSGRYDRDETAGPNKPFRDLAWGLASRGVAVLRYDKRTNVCRVPLSDWDVDNIVVDDAVRALATLREQPDIDGDASFLVGHSLGAIATPRIASRDGAVSGGAMLAASARPITDVILDQIEHINGVDGVVTDAEQQELERLKSEMKRIDDGEVGPAEIIAGFPGSWWNSLVNYDQVATARQISTPLMLAQGGRDYQVSPSADFETWQAELDGRPETRFELYPELSHLFHSGSEPSLPEEYGFHDNVPKAVVEDLASWITGQQGG